MVSSHCEEASHSPPWGGMGWSQLGRAQLGSKGQSLHPQPRGCFGWLWDQAAESDQSPWARAIQWQRDMVVPRKGRGPGLGLSLERTKAESSCSVGASERLSYCTGS